MKPQTDRSEPGGNRTTVDMSPEAIDQRLDMVSALYDLGKYLRTARPVENAVEQSGQRRSDENASQ